MTQDETIAQLQGVFDEVFLDPIVLTPERTAEEVEEWDSLLQISLVIAVESHFGITFRVGEVEGAQNVGEFADLIRKHVDG